MLMDKDFFCSVSWLKRRLNLRHRPTVSHPISLVRNCIIVSDLKKVTLGGRVLVLGVEAT